MKRISEILEGLNVRKVCGDLSRLVREIYYDSREVDKDSAFVAIRGFRRDGHDFISPAYERGCQVFIVEAWPADTIPVTEEMVVVELNNTRKTLPLIARNFYNNVVQELKLIGITGTNGKTTTAYLMHAILKAAGWNPGLISTVENLVGSERYSTERTTPESLDLYRLLYQMYRKGMKSVVMEVSSHALELHRVRGIGFSAAVFTNLGHDHLDFHRTTRQYFGAKKKLFDNLHESARAIVNWDDRFGERILRNCAADAFMYSANKPDATVYLKSAQLLSEGIYLNLETPAGSMFVNTGLIGKHNLYNIMAAVTASISLGIQEEYIVKGIENLHRVPGRCERYISPSGFKVFIDYAHSPDALLRMLESLWEHHPQKLTVVFGCGGDRDNKKRPRMGKIAEDYADKIILTNDNPRSEDPLQIIDQIKSGIYDRSKVKIIPDRKLAIETALNEAEKNEVLLIAGKGHETYQEIADVKITLDDREIVETFLEKIA